MSAIATTVPLDDLGPRINVEHAAFERAGRTALEHACACGDLLIEAKAQLPHGQWLPWLAEYCPAISTQQAQRYMRLARRRPELDGAADPSRVTHLPIRRALALLAGETTDDDSAPGDDDDPEMREIAARATRSEETWRELTAELDALRDTGSRPITSVEEARETVRRIHALEDLEVRIAARINLDDADWRFIVYALATRLSPLDIDCPREMWRPPSLWRPRELARVERFLRALRKEVAR